MNLSQNLIWNALPLAVALSLLYLVVLVSIEVFSRKLGWSSEITRRIVHIWSGICTLLDFVYLPSALFLALISISLVGIALSQKFGWLTSVHDVKRNTFGEVFLPIGTLITYAISQGVATIFVPSILVMTLADSLAGITSDLLHKPRKTLLGSLVFFASAVVVLGLSSPINLATSMTTALIATLVERFSPIGSDNTTVPVATALLLLALQA